MHILKKAVFVLGIVVLVNVIACQASRIRRRRPRSCPKRTDLDGRCRKKCTSKSECKSKGNRKKACLCDGLCGLSCIRLRPNLCREDRDLITKLKRGKVLLNGKLYQKTDFKFGDVITYQCKQGFKLTGPSKVTCSGIGKWKPWDKGTPSCKRACPDPGNPKDGRAFGDSFEAGKRIRFRCNPGYKMTGSPVATCLSTLQWNVPPPKCEVSSCGNPKLQENGRIYKGKKDFYQYGDRVYLSCESGYFRRGSPLIICDLDGWKVRGSSPASCTPKSCGSPGNLRNGYVEGTMYSYKNIVKFLCNNGYEIKGATYRICLQNQRWSGAVPTCEPVDCGQRKDIENGAFEGFGTKLNDKYYVKCLSGYVLSGSKEITCLASGKWSSEPKCSLVICDSSYSLIDNGKVTGNDAGDKCTNTYNCRLSFECNVGYYLSDLRLKHSVCEVNGRWTNVKPTCQPVFCGTPNAPLYGMLTKESSNFYYPSTVHYTCNTGYDLIGGSSRNCLSTRQWSGALPSCIANCGDPGKPEHGKRIGDVFTQDNYVQFACDKGYDMIGRAQITCQRFNAKWSLNKPECRARDCGNPGTITGGRIITSSPSFKFPSVIRYECFSGYDMGGSNEVKCEADGKWSKIPSCTANCGDPGKPENGYKTGSSFKGDDTVRFTCNDGYDLIGSLEITCQRWNAKWSDSVPKCEPKDCGDPRPIIGGHLKEFHLSFKFPSVIQYECLEGYDMDGPTSRLQCQANGQWNIIPSCIANCGDPGKPENGYKTGSSFKKDDTVRFTCNDGYDLIGSQRITCEQKNAKWSDLVPGCKLKDCGDPKTVDGGLVIGNFSTTYASVVRYKCLDGYDMDGTSHTQCQADGSWSKRPKCTGKPCDKPPNLKDGKILESKQRYSFPDAVEYGCNNGFRLARRSNIECDKDGKWTKLDAQCNEITCLDPEKLKDGQVIPDAIRTTRVAYKFGSKVRFECIAGYRLNGEKTSECNEDGWSGSKRSCSEITCNEPERIPNGKYTFTESLTSDGKFRLNSKVTYVCARDYELKGDKTSTCGEGGWSLGRRFCERVTCAVPNIANAKLEDGKKVYQKGDKVQVECKTGFELESSAKKEVICENKDQWSSLPKCVATVGSCDTPLGMKSGAIKDDQITMERSASAFATKGRLDGRLWCGRYLNGEVRVTIKLKSVVTITSVLFQGDKRLSSYMATEVRFRYFDANDAAGVQRLKTAKKYIINQRTGIKSKVIIENPIKTSYFEMILIKGSSLKGFACERFEIFGCRAKTTCGIPAAPINGEALGIIYKKGSNAVYTCNKGYKLAHEDPQRCTASGDWTGKIPHCIRETCKSPLGMRNGAIKDEQITMQRSHNSYGGKARLDGNIWCGSYVNGKVNVTIKFKSVVTIASVLFQGSEHLRSHLAQRVYFRYFDAESDAKRKWLNHTKNYQIIRKTGIVEKVSFTDDSIKTSHLEIVMVKPSQNKPFACERFEIFGCQAKTTCGIPAAPVNGEALGIIYKKGSKAVYTCNQGYKLAHEDPQTCTASGDWTGKIPHCIRGCENPLGIENGMIANEQITMQRSTPSTKGSKGRLNGDIWCGSYESNEVAVKVKFNSVVKVSSVLFQVAPGQPKADKVLFRYYNADSKGGIFKTTQPASIVKQSNNERRFSFAEPINISYLEMVFLRPSAESSVCERFEIFGCQAKTTCNIPQAPENGEALRMSYKEGSHAVYSCNQGYKLMNANKQTCTASGKWTGESSRCIGDTTQIGCYKDRLNPNRLFTFIGNNYTPDGCVSVCKRRWSEYSYAGLQYSKECFCGTEDNLRRGVEADDGDCYIPCKMDPSRKCGGPLRMSVYSIN